MIDSTDVASEDGALMRHAGRAPVTFGSGATKEELDEIIRQSLTLWPAVSNQSLVPAQ
jgi:hypothetical protein